MRRVPKLSVWLSAVAFLSFSAYAYTRPAVGTSGVRKSLSAQSLPSRPAAQQQPAAAQRSTYAPARNSFGQPDLEGVWRVWSLAAHDLEPHSASHETPAGLGVIVDPPDRLIPYKPWARARRDQNFAASRIKYPWDPVVGPDPLGRCYLPGVPRITYLGYAFQIFQTPTQLIFNYEWGHVKRQIPLNNSPRLKAPEYFMGIPRGRFEGNTLVVDVTNLSDYVWLDKAGNFFTRTAHVVERYTPVAPDELQYEVIIEDPRTYTRPWTIRLPIRRQTDAPLLEYECVTHLEEAGRPPIWERNWDKEIPVPNE